MRIDENDFPSLFRASDFVSLQAQQTYLRCFSLDLGLIVASALSGAISVSDPNYKFIFAFASGIFMAGGLILTLYIRVKQFEQNWFDGRAVAESVKTRTWRFIAGSKRYHQLLTEAEAIQLFTDDLSDIVKERKRFIGFLSINSDVAPQITEKMLEVRNLSFPEKKEIYLQQRLNDQKNWYASKSNANTKSSNLFFNLIIAFQGLALISSFVLIKYPEFPIGLPAVFATMAATFVAWLQLKRHQELATSYGLAAQELSFIVEKIRFVENQEAFSVFVSEAENAISREHTLWVARRDKA